MKLLFLLSVLSISQFSFAAGGEQNLPVEPTIEGLERKISEDEIQLLLDWANNTQKELSFLKERLSRFGSRDIDEKIELYEDELARIVTENEDLNALDMRKYLNRALMINKELKDCSGFFCSTKKFRLYMFEMTTAFAEQAYTSDIDFLRGTKTIGSVVELTKLQQLLFHLYGKAQMSGTKISESDRIKFLKLMGGYLNRDFFESDYAQKNAFEIKKINEFLDKKKLSDEDVANVISLLKRLGTTENSERQGGTFISLQVGSRTYSGTFSSVYQFAKWCMNYSGISDAYSSVYHTNATININASKVVELSSAINFSYFDNRGQICIAATAIVAKSSIPKTSLYPYYTLGSLHSGKYNFYFEGFSKSDVFNKCKKYIESNRLTTTSFYQVYSSNGKDAFMSSDTYLESAQVICSEIVSHL